MPSSAVLLEGGSSRFRAPEGPEEAQACFRRHFDTRDDDMDDGADFDDV